MKIFDFTSAAKFTKHCKTNLRQCYNIQKVYDRFMIKCDLHTLVRQSYEKMYDSTYESIKHTCSDYFDFSFVYTKLKLYNTCILPIFLYGSECWAVTKNDVRKIDAPDQWCLRMLLGINWHQHVRNDEVRRLTKQPHLSAIVQSRRLSLFGHIARMPDETDAKQILTAPPAGNWTRPLGRPRITWMKTIQQDLKSSDLNMDDAVDLAQNHPLWRLMSTFSATHS